MKKIYFLLLCVVFSSMAFAQNDSSRAEYKRSFWAEGGIGTANNNIAIAGCASVEILKNVIFSYEFDGSFDLDYVIGEPNSTDTESRGFTLGYLAKHKQDLFYFSTGATRIRGVKRDGITEGNYDIWSLKVKVGFLYTWEYVAIGVSPYININSELLYGGITANLAFGRFIKLK